MKDIIIYRTSERNILVRIEKLLRLLKYKNLIEGYVREEEGYDYIFYLDVVKKEYFIMDYHQLYTSITLGIPLELDVSKWRRRSVSTFFELETFIKENIIDQLTEENLNNILKYYIYEKTFETSNPHILKKTNIKIREWQHK